LLRRGRSLDRRGARLGVAPVLLLVALGGMYATVPDTDAVRAAIGALVPLTLLACPRAVATLGAAGAYAATAVAIWLAVVEGSARPGAVIGALGCLALLIGEPVGSALVDRVGWCARVNSGTSTLGPAPRVVVLVVLQFVFVLYAARVAGLQTNATRATLLLVPEVVAVVGAGVVFGIPRYGTAARRAQKGRI